MNDRITHQVTHTSEEHQHVGHMTQHFQSYQSRSQTHILLMLADLPMGPAILCPPSAWFCPRLPPALPKPLHGPNSAGVGVAYLASSVSFVGQHNSLWWPSAPPPAVTVMPYGTFATVLSWLKQHAPNKKMCLNCTLNYQSKWVWDRVSKVPLY